MPNSDFFVPINGQKTDENPDHDPNPTHFDGNDERALTVIPFEFSWGTRLCLSISNKRKPKKPVT